MNRKERRAAQKQGKGGGPFAPGSPSAPAQAPSPAALSANLFASAIQAFNAGQLEQAERLCRDVLTFDRDHFDSLHMLGIIGMRVGRYDAAIELLGRALAANAHSAECHFNLAQVLRAVGRLDEAAAHFSEATLLKRDYAAAQVALADTLVQQGKLDDAQARYERAQVLDPRIAEAPYGLANLAMQQGRLDEAAALYRRVLALRPDFAEARSNLGVALAALGRPDEAAAEYRQALALRPDLIDIYRNLARLLLAQGDAEQALAVVRRGLKIAETEEIKAAFVQCARGLRAIPADDELRALLARAMSEGWDRPGELSGIAATLFKESDAGKGLWGPDALAAAGRDPLLRGLLKSAPVHDVELERFLTHARTHLLALATGPDTGTPDESAFGFFCALARQCFINEYVFARGEEEVVQALALRDRLDAALAGGVAVPALWPVAAAAYLPLHSLAQAAALLARPWPQPMQALLEQQVQEPLEERQIRATIPALTAIDDEVSVKVRQQYEDMPYPRWIKTAPTGRPMSVDWYLRNQFPLAPIRSPGNRTGLDVLIAGCGTGQHAIETAQRFAGARVLAIDLSLTSLGYAKRKTRAHGLGNIDYAQADILKLGPLGQRFDLIEAIGVLHHLRDPAEGFRVLVSLLRPGGFMHIGLYSALARADVNAARAFIAERGYGQSADDIRQCRQDLIAMPDGTPGKNVTRFTDFFTTSECRDLLFHVQEHQLTIPQIKALLAESNLAFIGFSGRAVADYRKRFPEDRAATDLDRWQLFETENPAAFVNMYQFWVQKP